MVISITDPGNTESVIPVGSTHRFEQHTNGEQIPFHATLLSTMTVE
jgi:hypothetical protein